MGHGGRGMVGGRSGWGMVGRLVGEYAYQVVSICRSRRPRINVGASGGKPVSGQGRSGGKEEGEGSKEKKGLSNADFRKLFTSK